MTILDVICPVYREEEVIASFHARLAKTLDILPDNYTVHITYVVDPSPDRTEDILASIGQADRRVEILTMSRRFGHQMALVAGIDHSDGDIIVMLDSDLQHPPELIPELLRHWEEGSEIVQTIRTDGAETNWLKRSTSRWFYTTFMKVGAVNLQSGAADYRLISRRVAQVFRKEIREHNQFLRGLVSWVGYRVSFVPFTPVKREQGKSKYRPATLLNFALNGILLVFKGAVALLHRGRIHPGDAQPARSSRADPDVRDRQRRRAWMDVADRDGLLRQRGPAIFPGRFGRIRQPHFRRSQRPSPVSARPTASSQCRSAARRCRL